MEETKEDGETEKGERRLRRRRRRRTRQYESSKLGDLSGLHPTRHPVDRSTIYYRVSACVCVCVCAIVSLLIVSLLACPATKL